MKGRHHLRSSVMGVRFVFGAHRKRRSCCIAVAKWTVARCIAEPRPWNGGQGQGHSQGDQQGQDPH